VSDLVRQRLVAAGVRLPDGLLDLLAAAATPLLEALDQLAASAPRDVEPFRADRLVRDAHLRGA